MKVALCLEYPIDLQGGVSVLVRILAREFSRHGHEVVLVSPDSPETMARSETGKHVGVHLSHDPTKPSPQTARHLARRLADAQIDLAHFHMGGNYGWGNRFIGHCPIPYLSKLGVPCFSTVHLVVDILNGYCGPQKPLWFKLLLLPLAWLGKVHQLRHVRREIAVSRHDINKLRRWYAILSSRFVQIYHSRLDREAAGPQETPRQPVILNVGHVAWRKGQPTLAEAFARIAPRHPHWTLQLAGHDGADGAFGRIGEIIREHKLEQSLVLLGERNDALELMRRASIYVQPSTAEALGLALQEAMFEGCASIGARAGGIPELIDDGFTGRLVAPGDVGELAAALEEMIANPELREKWGKAGAKSIRERGMTAQAMAKRHLELYATAR
jgi:glycosyltransferase involved in cell wall biosynthesis